MKKRRTADQVALWLRDVDHDLAVVDAGRRRRELESEVERLERLLDITDHYLNDPFMLVKLATVDRDDLRDSLEESWRLGAPKRLLAVRDGDPESKARP